MDNSIQQLPKKLSSEQFNNEEEDGGGAYQDYDDDGQPLPWSLLTITIKRADNLPNEEFGSKSDAYVQAEFKSTTLQTDPVSNNINPKWHQRVHFQVGGLEGTNDMNEYLVLKVFDYNVILQNKVIGVYRIQMRDLFKLKKNSDIRKELISEVEYLNLSKPVAAASEVNESVKAATLKDNLGVIRFSYNRKALFTQADLEESLSSDRRHIITAQIAQHRAHSSLYRALPHLKESEKGILMVHVHSLTGVQDVTQYYELQLKVGSLDKIKAKTELPGSVAESQEKKKPPMQYAKPIYLAVHGPFLESDLTINLYKKGVIQRTLVGQFHCSFAQALDLLSPGNPPMTLEFNKFQYDSGYSKNTFGDYNNINTIPKLIATISYTNSLYTQMPRGKLRFKVKSWNYNGSSFPPNHYLQIKVGSRPSKDCKILYMPHEFELTQENMLETLTLTVAMDKSVLMDPVITSTKIYVFELFSSRDSTNSGNIYFQQIIHKIEFSDVIKQCEISVALESKFEPIALNPEQVLSLQNQYYVWSQSRIKTDDGGVDDDINNTIHKQMEFKDHEEGDEEQKDGVDGKKESKGKRDELVELKVAKTPLFSQDTSKGVLVIVLRSVSLKGAIMNIVKEGATAVAVTKQPEVAVPQVEKKLADLVVKKIEDAHDKVYFLFKTSRMVLRTKTFQADFKTQSIALFNELIMLKVGEYREHIKIKLMRECDLPGKLDDYIAFTTLEMDKKLDKDKPLFEWTWKKVPTELGMAKNPTFKEVITPYLRLDMQYRYSSFTQMPRGKLEVILVNGQDLKLNNSSYKPVMEFRLGLQRILVDEPVNPMKAQWSNRVLEFETHSPWDQLEIRFYSDEETQLRDNRVVGGETNKITNLSIMGAFYKNLSSIYFDDDTATSMILELKEMVNEQLSGNIKLQFEYRPFKDNLEKEKTLVMQAMAQSQKAEKEPTAAASKSNSKTSKQQQNTVKQGMCYISLLEVEVQGVPPEKSYNVENIRLEMIYGDQRCLSRTTTDLSRTGNKENINDSFRLVFEEHVLNKIQIRAFDIDYAAQFENNKTQELVGECQIDPLMIRQHKGQELHYQCTLDIEEDHFMKLSIQQQAKNGTLDDLNKQIISQNEGEQDLQGVLDRLTRIGAGDGPQITEIPQLILTFQIFYFSTPFTHSPIGLVTFNNVSLINLGNMIPEQYMKHFYPPKNAPKIGNAWQKDVHGGVYCEFKLNKNKNTSDQAEYINHEAAKDTQYLEKQGICMFNQEYDPIDVMRAGRPYTVNSKKLQSKSYFRWSRQFVLHSNSVQDELQIRVIWEVPSEIDQSIGKNKKRFVLGSTNISLSDASFFDTMPVQGKDGSLLRGEPLTVALLMDFQKSEGIIKALNVINPGSNIMQSHNQEGAGPMFNTNIGDKDLASKHYNHQLIMICDMHFARGTAIFEDEKELKGLMKANNLYLMNKQEIPAAISFEGNVNDRYANLSKNRLGDMAASKQEGAALSLTQAKQLLIDQKKKSHMLIDVEIINLNSILKGVFGNRAMYCFVAIEPLSAEDSVKSYVTSVAKAYDEQKKKEDLRKFQQSHQLVSPSQAAINETSTQADTRQMLANKAEAIKKLRDMGYSQELMEGEFLAQPEDLIRPASQISPRVFAVSDFELHPLNTDLEIWVPVDTQRVMLSLAVQMDGKMNEVDSFRRCVLDHGLSRNQTLLGLHRLATYGLLQPPTSNIETIYEVAKPMYASVRLFQALIDLQVPVQKQQAIPKQSLTNLSDKRVFKQCCSLAELSMGSQGGEGGQGGNHLMSSPLCLSQTVVTTRIQSSNFIDTPSGLLTVALRKMTHTSSNFYEEDIYLRLELTSKIERDKVHASFTTKEMKSLLKESFDTEALDSYRIARPETGQKGSTSSKKTSIQMNESNIFLLRHFSDQLILSMYQRPHSVVRESNLNNADSYSTCIFRTKIDLNTLELNEEKMTVRLIGTSPMSKATSSNIVYYTFELDMLFKARLQSSSPMDEYDIALENYHMMKQQQQQKPGDTTVQIREMKISPAELQVLKMMVDRIKLGQKLTNNRIRARRCMFTLRNMMPVQYYSGNLPKPNIEEKLVFNLRVNPRSFMMGAGFGKAQDIANGSKQLTAMQEQEITKELQMEFRKCEVVPDFIYSNLSLTKGTIIERHNALMVEIVKTSYSNLPSAGVLSGQVTPANKPKQSKNLINTSAISNSVNNNLLAQKYKKLFFIATQDQQTINKTDILLNINSTIDENLLLSGTKILYRNVTSEQLLTFRFQAQLHSDGNVMSKAAGGRNKEENIITLGMTKVKVEQLNLKTWTSIEKVYPLTESSSTSGSLLQEVTLRFTLLHSDFTKNPCKVMSLNFHRVIHLPSQLTVEPPRVQGSGLQLDKDSKQDARRNNKHDATLILKESPIFTKKLTKIEEFQQQASAAIASNQMTASQSFGQGSMKQHLQEATQGGGAATVTSSGGVYVRMEYDNSKHSQGVVSGGDHTEYDVNAFGKTHLIATKELNRISVNNTRHDGSVKFKICLGNSTHQSTQGHSSKKDHQVAEEDDLICVATAEFFLAEIKSMPNQQVNIFIPLKLLQDTPSSGLSAITAFKDRYQFHEEDLYVLASICITDRTFGEVNFNIDKILDIPRSPLIRAVQWRLKLMTPQAYNSHKQNNFQPETVENGILFKHSGERFDFRKDCPDDYEVDREFNIQMELKDIFGGGGDDNLDSNKIQMYAMYDRHLIIEVVGFNENNSTEYVLGSYEKSIFDMIQKQFQHQRDLERDALNALSAGALLGSLNPAQAMDTMSRMSVKDKDDFRAKALETAASQRAENEYGECSAKFQKLFKNSYVSFNKAKDGIIQKKADEQLLINTSKQVASSQIPKSQNSKPEHLIPEGYRRFALIQPIYLPSNQTAIELDASNNAQRYKIHNQVGYPELSAKMEFSFSFKKHAELTKEELDLKDEQRELDRLRMGNNIGTILDTLKIANKEDKDLIFTLLKRLGFVLATKTPSMNLSLQQQMLKLQSAKTMHKQLEQIDPDDLADIEDVMSADGKPEDGARQALNNIELIIEVMCDIVILLLGSERGPDVNAFIQVMRVLTYLKIICGQNTMKAMSRYKAEVIKQSKLMECLVDSFLQYNEQANCQQLKSPTYAVSFLNFLSTQLSDFSALYYKAFPGFKLEKLMIATLAVDPGNALLVQAHSRFLDSMGQCLMKETGKREQLTERERELVRVDIGRVMKQLIFNIHEGLDKLKVYKNMYETIASQLCQSALHIVHELILHEAKRLEQSSHYASKQSVEGSTSVAPKDSTLSKHESLKQESSKQSESLVKPGLEGSKQQDSLNKQSSQLNNEIKQIGGIVNEADKPDIARLLVEVLRIIVEGIKNETSTSFVDELKRRLNYELQMANQYKTETQLQLSFPHEQLLPLFKILLDKFYKLLSERSLIGAGSAVDGLKLFERTRTILEYFATATGTQGNTSTFGLNTFGEENRDLIGKVLRIASSDIDDRLKNADFVIFLENVVKADFEYEDELMTNANQLKSQKKGKTARDRAAFFAANYGDKEAKNSAAADLVTVLKTANKYSLSKIEWMDDFQ